MTEVYPGIEQTPLFGALARCMRDRTMEVFENQFTYPDQTTRWFEVRVQPIAEGICVYSRDIEGAKSAAAGARGDDVETEAYVAALVSRWRSWSSGSS